MEPEIQNSNKHKWSDDTLNKLTCKELKKLARQSNINPNFKKAELVQALKSSMMLTEVLETENVIISKENARRTRSRASMFPSSVTSISESINDAKTVETDNEPAVDKPTRTKNENKRRGKKLLEKEIDSETKNDVMETFQIVSSIPSKPLEEITNKSKIHTIENQMLNSNKENDKNKQTRRKQGRNVSSDNETNNTKRTNGHLSETDDTKNDDNSRLSEKVNNSKTEKELSEINVTENESTRVKEENLEQPNKKTRRGRKKNTTEVKVEGDVNDGSKTECQDTNRSETTTDIETINTSKNKKKQKRTVSKGKKSQDSGEENEIPCKSQKKEMDSVQTELLARSGEGKNIECFNNDQTINSKCTENEPKGSLLEEEKSSLISNTPKSTNDISAESEMPVPVVVRGSTFILDSPVSSDKEESSKNSTFELPARSNTFTIDENVSEEQNQRRSLRFAPDPALQKKSNLNQATSNTEKSIGKRILAVSKVQSTTKSTTKITGSSVKKTITKNTSTPGSVFRSKTASGAKKLPNFKSIHQRLFSNMESLGDNQKRKNERAQALLLSPAPRCATSLLSPRTSLSKIVPSPKPLTPAKTQISTAKTPRTVTKKPFTSVTNVNSVSTTKKSPRMSNVSTVSTTTKTPRMSNVSSVSTTKMPRTASKSTHADSTAINRFGFKTRVTKAEANTIAGKKLPPISMEKKKDQDRKFLHGVRTNKRFMLQMQMRMGQSQN